MATSSITHNFVISSPKNVQNFVSAMDKASKVPQKRQELPGRQLTDPKEILDLMARRKRRHG